MARGRRGKKRQPGRRRKSTRSGESMERRCALVGEYLTRLERGDERLALEARVQLARVASEGHAFLMVQPDTERLFRAIASLSSKEMAALRNGRHDSLEYRRGIRALLPLADDVLRDLARDALYDVFRHTDDPDDLVATAYGLLWLRRWRDGQPPLRDNPLVLLLLEDALEDASDALRVVRERGSDQSGHSPGGDDPDAMFRDFGSLVKVRLSEPFRATKVVELALACERLALPIPPPDINFNINTRFWKKFPAEPVLVEFAETFLLLSARDVARRLSDDPGSPEMVRLVIHALGELAREAQAAEQPDADEIRRASEFLAKNHREPVFFTEIIAAVLSGMSRPRLGQWLSSRSEPTA